MTIKQRLFIKYYVEYGNATEAAMRIYNVKRRETAAQIGYENLRKPEVIASIHWYFTHRTPDPVYITKVLNDLLEHGTPAQRLRASIACLKMIGAYPK